MKLFTDLDLQKLKVEWMDMWWVSGWLLWLLTRLLWQKGLKFKTSTSDEGLWSCWPLGFFIYFLLIFLLIHSKILSNLQIMFFPFRLGCILFLQIISDKFENCYWHKSVPTTRPWRVGLFDFGSGSGRIWPKSSGFGFGYCAYYGVKANSLIIFL